MNNISPPWPGGAKAAISFTMDNLGEAQDVNKGTWRDPIGTHYSITNQLPRMLDLLDKYGIKATYFAESWSLGVYPDVVRDVSAHRGHEIAWHGYQHEVWSSLSPETEVINFKQSFKKAVAAGIQYAGFRPPGGKVNEGTYQLLREHGVRYISPLGNFGIGRERIVVLPFEWRAVDAFYYMEKFAAIRESHGEQREVLSPTTFRDFLMAKIDETVKCQGHMSILFHPFLQTSEEKFAVMEEVLTRISGDSEIWCAPCGQVAGWVTDHLDCFPRLGPES
ncbi:hypothetical protein B0T22DRAFT_170970 [Podospora appendiculata]|uniref:NodB homology domain-containing protein n=1 Tax=Podospora appendiculata TaxID=314037 RepID=A0AAE1CDA0_9PEZI|nr:hypothetical protein B0T22DRAFT_170970 [Podospora appendiculata]